MDIHILSLIAGHNKELWRLFSMLNCKCYTYFNNLSIKYELIFREIIIEEDLKRYILNGKQHRSDGPAIIFNDGTNVWYYNGLRHRSDGPAVLWSDGSKEWYYNGKFVNYL